MAKRFRYNHKIVKAVADYPLFGIKEGMEYQYLNRYWRDGEGWYTIKDKAGKVFDAPDVMLTEPYYV